MSIFEELRVLRNDVVRRETVPKVSFFFCPKRNHATAMMRLDFAIEGEKLG
jgi:hypothetical protein